MAGPAAYYHWEVTYDGKTYDFYALPDGNAICTFSTGRLKVVNREDPQMRAMALFRPGIA